MSSKSEKISSSKKKCACELDKESNEPSMKEFLNYLSDKYMPSNQQYKKSK
jgi:hypothetical protein